jgi:hypothetical protein
MNAHKRQLAVMNGGGLSSGGDLRGRTAVLNLTRARPERLRHDKQRAALELGWNQIAGREKDERGTYLSAAASVLEKCDDEVSTHPAVFLSFEVDSFDLVVFDFEYSLEAEESVDAEIAGCSLYQYGQNAQTMEMRTDPEFKTRTTKVTRATKEATAVNRIQKAAKQPLLKLKGNTLLDMPEVVFMSDRDRGCAWVTVADARHDHDQEVLQKVSSIIY